MPTPEPCGSYSAESDHPHSQKKKRKMPDKSSSSGSGRGSGKRLTQWQIGSMGSEMGLLAPDTIPVQPDGSNNVIQPDSSPSPHQSGSHAFSGSTTDHVSSASGHISINPSPQSHAPLVDSPSSDDTPAVVVSPGHSEEQRRVGHGRAIGNETPVNVDSRILITLTDSGSFEDSKVVRTISKNLKNMLAAPYKTYNAFSSEHKNACWNRFKSIYRWDEADAVRIRQLYNAACRDRFSGAINHAKENYLKGRADPVWGARNRCWIPGELLPHYVQYWESDEAMEKSRKARENRKKGPTKTHFGGSISIEGHIRKKAKKLNVSPAEIPFGEIWMETRTVERPGGEVEWANDKAQEAYEAYIADCMRLHGDNQSEWPAWDMKVWLKAIGPTKRNRLPGVPKLGDSEFLGVQLRKEQKHIVSTFRNNQSRETDAIIEAQKSQIATQNDQIKALQSKISHFEQNQALLMQLVQQMQRQMGMQVSSVFSASPAGTRVPILDDHA